MSTPTADVALSAWDRLTRIERNYAVGVLSWTNPDAVIAAAEAARRFTAEVQIRNKPKRDCYQVSALDTPVMPE